MLRIPKLWGKGLPPSATALNVSPVCESRIFCGAAVMANMTGMEKRCPVSELANRIVALNVPPPSVSGFAVTASKMGPPAVSEPLAGET